MNQVSINAIAVNEDNEDDFWIEDETDAKNPDAAVIQLLFNINFINSVKNLLFLLDPIAKLMNIYQKSDCSVADDVEQWLDL